MPLLTSLRAAAALSIIALALLLVGFPFATATSTNLIPNPSVESTHDSKPKDWKKQSSGNNKATFKHTSDAYDGTKGLEVKMENVKGGSAHWRFDTVSIKADTQYTYAEYYKADVETRLEARVRLHEKNKNGKDRDNDDDDDGATIIINLGTLPAASSWTKKQVTFTMPWNAKRVTVQHVIAKKGTLKTDNFSLVETSGASSSSTSSLVSSKSSVASSKSASSAIGGGQNLILNPSLEAGSNGKPTNWTSNTWGENKAKFTYPAESQHGSRGASITITAYESGDAKWYFDDIAVTPGEQYLFTNYYKSDDETYLDVRFTLSDGSYLYDYLASVPVSAEWKQASTTIIVPSNAVSMTIFHLLASNCTLLVDNFSLTLLTQGSSLSSSRTSSLSSSRESSSISSSRSSDITSVASSSRSSLARSTSSVASSRSNISSSSSRSSVVSSRSSAASSVPSGTNLILNPSVEAIGANGDPANWHRGGFGLNDATFTYPAEAQEGARGAAITITTYTDGDAKWYFDDVAVSPGQQLLFSDFYKSTGPNVVIIRYTLSNNAFAYIQIGVPATTTTWQPFSANFTVPANAVSLTVFHLLQGVGTLTIDNASLTPLDDEPPADAFDKGYVSLTFDDGWSSHYAIVRPMLNTAGLKGSFFIITGTGAAGSPAAGDVNDPFAYLNFAQLQQMQNDGHEISAHTRTHASLTQTSELNDHVLSTAERIAEIQGSRSDLISQGFSPVDTFVYPYGDFNADIIQLVKNAGFIGARSVLEGLNVKTSNTYALQVRNVLSSTTAAEMQSWINEAVQTKTWLIIVIHRVDATNDAYGTTPSTLQTVVHYLVQQAIPVITMHEGLQMMP